MPQTIAFLGATGGCAGYCLVAALKDGYMCRALARDPSKLQTSLKSKGVSSDLISNLHITQGNAKDVDSVKALLKTDSGVVDTVVYGIGGKPVLRFHYKPFTLDDPQVCQTTMATLLAALQDLGTTKPRAIVISSTGLVDHPRDVPALIAPIYHWMLAVPHADKKVLESLVKEQKDQNGEEKVLGDFVLVRPSFLTDGSGKGLESVRFGVENNPAVGYSIARKDVGEWIYEKLVKPEGLGELKDQSVSVTY